MMNRKQIFKKKTNFFCWDHVGHCLMIVFILFVPIALLTNLNIFNPVKKAFKDFSLTDVYFNIQRDDVLEIDNRFIIVDITELRTRSEIANTINVIKECAPKLIVVDVIFEREGNDYIGNADLAEAIGNSNNILMANKLINYNPENKSFEKVVNSFFSEYINTACGYANVLQYSTGGCVRRYSISQKLNGNTVYSMPYMAVCMFKGETPSVSDNNERLIAYGNKDFAVIKYNEIENKKGLLADKIVMLGTISTEEDSHITPIGKIPGVKIQAYSIMSYLDHANMTQMSFAASILLMLIICYISAWVCYFLPTKISPPIWLYVGKLYYFLVAAFLVWGAFICFVIFDYNINLLYPLFGLALVEEARSHYKWLIGMLQMHTKFKFPLKSIYKL